MLGYDLDGTLCSPTPGRAKSYFRQNAAERLAHEEVLRAHYLGATLIMTPQEPFVVITGRHERYRPETAAWLEGHGLRPAAVEMLAGSKTRTNMVAHKLAACSKYGVEQYFEDDPAIARALAEQGVCVVLVSRELSPAQGR